MPTKVYDPEDLDSKERQASPTGEHDKVDLSPGEQANLDQMEAGLRDGDLYSPDEEGAGKKDETKADKKKKLLAWGAGGGIVGALIAGFFAIQPFQLLHLMNNIELNTHVRLNIDMRGRSKAWLQAYIAARLLDIESGPDNQSTSGNLLFRADCPNDGLNVMFCRWYKAMRAAPRFEQEVFERHGIRFSSVAFREGGQLRIRPARITINQERFEITIAEMGLDEDFLERLRNGDVTALQQFETRTGRLAEFADIDKYENDRNARKAIVELTREQYPRWWHAFKRYQVRRDIYNMTGIRSWRFFETSRDKLREGYIGVRNKVILKMLPSSAKNGNFIGCLFGISECRASTDIANPANRAPTADPDDRSRENDQTADLDGDPSTPETPVGDGSGTDNIGDSLGDGLDVNPGESIGKKITQQLISKLNLATGIASFLDALARFDEAIQNHSLSTMVTMARGTQLIGLYTTYKIAADQQKTGEFFVEELGALNQTVRHSTNNEGWQTVVDPPGGTASAAEVRQAADKEEFCGNEYQLWMETNPIEANQVYQYSCPSSKIGGPSLAAELENGWNNSVGAVLGPILEAYRNTLGGIFSFFSDIIGAVTGPIVDGVIAALGLTDDLEALMGWLGEKIMAFAGGGPMINELTPQGQMVNFMIQGGAFLSESSMRYQGAAQTTGETRQGAMERYYAHLEQQRRNESFKDRYLDTNNPTSLTAKTMFTMARWSYDVPGSLSSAALAVGNPFKFLLTPISAVTSAADEPQPYAGANFAQIETYDFPTNCTNANPITMTLQSATNADDLGIFTAEELNWDMITNKDKFYTDLYAKLGEGPEADAKAKTVWNCALLDNATSAGMGGLYGYKGAAAYE
jgi:hypothetical protein